MGSMIHTSGLTKRYGSTAALDSLDLDIEAGAVFGLLGPNGAGKTTAIRLLLGLSRPSSGSASIAGLDPWSDIVAVHRIVSYVPGEASLWPQLTGGEVIDFLGNLHGGVDAVRRNALIDRFELDPSKRCRAYSKGNRQKVLLVAALSQRSSVLILDEPTSGLDPLMEVEFRHVIAEAAAQGTTVLLSSHILSEAQALCARVGILRSGKLIEVAAIDELRRLGVVELEIGFVGEPPNLEGLPGIEHVDTGMPGRITMSFSGDLNQLLARVARANVTSLVSREPDLEDIFLRFYSAPSSTDSP